MMMVCIVPHQNNGYLKWVVFIDCVIFPSGDDSPVVPIYVRKSTLRLPYRSTCPVIMVGPGTGLAPFRGFIEDRCVTKNEGTFVVCILMLGGYVRFFRHRVYAL